MTVPTTNITAGPYVGNGLVDTYDFDFGIIDTSEIRVFETDTAGVVTELTLTVDYTVVIVDEFSGTVTRVAGVLPTGYQWYMRSNIQSTQGTAFASQGAFFPEIHEAAFDKNTKLTQQVEDKLQRSVKLKDSDTSGVDVTLEPVSPGGAFRWNAAGTGIEYFDPASTGYYSQSQELFTATEGQTEFTFTGLTYKSNSNNLTLYIDGRRQHPGAYTETSSTVFTFSEGLSVGQEVLAVINEPETATTVFASDTPVAGKVATWTGIQQFLLSDLKGLTATDGQVVQTAGETVIGDSGGGLWTWVATDLSSEVSKDPGESFYAASNSDPLGLSGAWVKSLNLCPNINVALTTQIDVNNVIGTQDGSGSLFAYHFELTAGPSSSGTDPIRGLIGRVNNSNGTGEIKAIRVGASDIGTSGAAALMAISADVRPNANTTAAYIAQLSEQANAATPDKVTGINFDTLNGNRWLNGIVFEQGMEVNDAWFQASMGAGSGASARFLKLKDAAAAELFYVDKLGHILTSGGATLNGAVTVGTSLALGSQVTASFNNTTRDYDLQAVTSGDYFRVLIGGVGDGLVLTANKNLGVGGVTDFGSGTGGIVGIPNATANPSTTPTGGGVLYVIGGALTYKGSSGTITTLGAA